MAKYKGNDGDVQIGGTTMAEVLAFTLTTGVGTAPSSVKGDTSDSHTVGRTNWQGTARVYLDDGDTPQNACVEGASVVLALRCGTSAGNRVFSGTATVTGVNVDSPEDAAAQDTIDFTFLGNGDLSRTTVGA